MSNTLLKSQFIDNTYVSPNLCLVAQAYRCSSRVSCNCQDSLNLHLRHGGRPDLALSINEPLRCDLISFETDKDGFCPCVVAF